MTQDNRDSDKKSLMTACSVVLLVVVVLGGMIYFAMKAAEKSNARSVAQALAIEIADKSVAANLPVGGPEEIVLREYSDPWEEHYRAFVTGTEDVVEVVVVSSGPNKTPDKRTLSKSGKWECGDDVIAMHTAKRPGYWSKKIKAGLKSGAASVAEGAVEGTVDGAKNKLQGLKDVIKGLREKDE